MRLSVALGVGVPCAVFAVGSVVMGPERLSALSCGFGDCSFSARVEELCEALQTSPELRTDLSERLPILWSGPAQRARVVRALRQSQGQAIDLILDELAASGDEEPLCPSLTEALVGTVRITPRRILVGGKALITLDAGHILPRDLGGIGLEVEGLIEHLPVNDERSTVALHAEPDTRFETLTQVVYSLGRAGASKVRVHMMSKVERRLDLELPSYGTCDACPADVPELYLASEGAYPDVLLAVVGRHGPTNDSRKLDGTRLLYIPESGPFQVLTSGEDAQDLLVSADPDQTLQDLMRAVRSLGGPLRERRPSISLALPEGQFRRDALDASVPVAVATQGALRTRKEHPPRQRETSRGERTAYVNASPRTKPAAPEKRNAPAASKRRVTASSISRSLRPQIQGLRYCYERELEIDRTLSGKVTLQFEISPRGRTSKVRLEDQGLDNERVVACIERRARHWRLPAPRSGPITITYPLVFTPTGT